MLNCLSKPLYSIHFTRKLSIQAALAFPDLQVTKKDGILTVVLDRPQRRNSATPTMMASLEEVMNRLQAEKRLDIPGDYPIKNVKVVVVKGSPPAFCAGRDLILSAGMRGNKDQEIDYMKTMANVVQRWATELDAITIAQVNGPAFGFGLEFALACDLRYTLDDAPLNFPEVGIGIIPGAGGSLITPMLTNLHTAKELILTSKRFTGRQAVEKYRLFNESFATEKELEQHVQETAHLISKHSREASFAAKRVLNRVAMNGENVGDLESWNMSFRNRMPLNDTPEYKAALDAFEARGSGRKSKG